MFVCVLFYVCVAIGFVDLVDKGFIHMKRVLKCAFGNLLLQILLQVYNTMYVNSDIYLLVITIVFTYSNVK